VVSNFVYDRKMLIFSSKILFSECKICRIVLGAYTYSVLILPTHSTLLPQLFYSGNVRIARHNIFSSVTPITHLNAFNCRIVFTLLYTVEMFIKMLARGLIVDEFAYLRDAWNWLDFVVVALA